MNNPINLIDPTGMEVDTDYILNKDGHISRKDPKDGSDKNLHDRLFVDSNEKKFITLNKKNASDDTVISDLSINYTDDINFSNENKKASDVFKTFIFVANNTNVEWNAGKSKNGTFYIGTNHSVSSVSGGSDFFVEPIASIHNHPGDMTDNGKYTQWIGEQCSMGYTDLISPNAYDPRIVAYGDWNNKRNFPNEIDYVYFPKTQNLWFVGYNAPVYIRNIKNNYKRLDFGTLF